MTLRLALAAALLPGVLSLTPGALAQAAAAPEPSAGPTARPAGDCFPACRRGFVCHQGACISACNPPCPPGHTCVAGQYCEAPQHEPRPYEPPPPPRKTFAELTHSALAFHMGLGGSVEVDGTSHELGTTLGFNLRSDTPLARYLLIGPLFQFGAWHPDASGDPSDNYYVDVSLLLRARIPLELGAVNAQLWAGPPIGLTLHFLGSDDAATRDGLGIGWNVGALVGGAVHFSRKLGMFAEAGWMQHRMRHDSLEGRAPSRYWIGQTSLNVGFVFGG